MMEREKIDAIAEICESMEKHFNDKMKSVVWRHDKTVALSVLVNLGTTLLAKAIALAGDDGPQVRAITLNILDDKVDEANAAISSLVAIGKAMGDIPKWPGEH